MRTAALLITFVLGAGMGPTSLLDELQRGRNCGSDIAPLCEFRLDKELVISWVRGGDDFGIQDMRERPKRRFNYAYTARERCLSVFEMVKGVLHAEASISIPTMTVHRYANCSDESARDVR